MAKTGSTSFLQITNVPSLNKIILPSFQTKMLQSSRSPTSCNKKRGKLYLVDFRTHYDNKLCKKRNYVI